MASEARQAAAEVRGHVHCSYTFGVRSTALQRTPSRVALDVPPSIGWVATSHSTCSASGDEATHAQGHQHRRRHTQRASEARRGRICQPVWDDRLRQGVGRSCVRVHWQPHGRWAVPCRTDGSVATTVASRACDSIGRGVAPRARVRGYTHTHTSCQSDSWACGSPPRAPCRPVQPPHLSRCDGGWWVVERWRC